ncbi:hypothetical protein EIP86_009706 [Pleurotus ostreatoroseus]|nr:hypothetical protein EIP86_009706 [Pleurotus ostreatoroseus]
MDDLEEHDLRPIDLYGPVPHTVVWPREHAPAGSRYCPEVDAFVPAHLPYRIRGLKKAKPRYRFLSKIMHRIRTGQPYENLVMAMGISHGELKLISLQEAQQRPDIVYRTVDILSAPKEPTRAQAWNQSCRKVAKKERRALRASYRRKRNEKRRARQEERVDQANEEGGEGQANEVGSIEDAENCQLETGEHDEA